MLGLIGIKNSILGSQTESEESKGNTAALAAVDEAGAGRSVEGKEETTIEDLKQRIADLEAQLLHLLQANNSSTESTPKGDVGRHATLPQTGLAPPVSDSFKVTAEVQPTENLRPLPKSLPMSATRVIMHQIVLPSEVDLMGICFGGQVLSWIDICAGLAAKSVAGGPCVTASVDSVHFLSPCHLGSVCIVAAMVNRTFASSMEVHSAILVGVDIVSEALSSI